MENKKIIIIAIAVIIVLAVVFGLVYQFVLKDKTPAEKGTGDTVYDESKIDDTTKGFLENELEITMGNFRTWNNIAEAKWESWLDVSVTNKTEATKTFEIEVAAVEAETNRIIRSESFEAKDLEPNVAQTIKIFENLERESHQEMLGANYKVVKITAK